MSEFEERKHAGHLTSLNLARTDQLSPVSSVSSVSVLIVTSDNTITSHVFFGMSWPGRRERLLRTPFHYMEHEISSLSLERTLSLLYRVAVEIQKMPYR